MQGFNLNTKLYLARLVAIQADQDTRQSKSPVSNS